MESRDGVRQVVAQLVDAYNAKDDQAMAALYHPEVTYWSALSGTREGATAVLDHVRELFATLPDETMHTVTVVADHETAVVEFRSTGHGPGDRRYTIDFTEVLELRDGLLHSIKVYLDPAQVAKATGS